jgi:hypothetical protein
MSLEWTFNGDAYTALSEPFVLVVQDLGATFDYYVWDKTAPHTDAMGSAPVAMGTVYSLARAKEAAESALFNVMMCRSTGWELFEAYWKRIGYKP